MKSNHLFLILLAWHLYGRPYCADNSKRLKGRTMRKLRWCAALMQPVAADLISTFKVNNLRNLLFAQSPTRLNEPGYARVWHGTRGIVPECRHLGSEQQHCREGSRCQSAAYSG